MKYIYDWYPITAAEVQIAVSEQFPDSTHGTIPPADQSDAVEAFRAYDDGGLEESPSALAAYLKHHRLISY